jgi:transcription elongation factor GreA
MTNKTYLTQQGLLEAQAELDYLAKSRLPELAQLLKDANSSKNLSTEEYNDIRGEQVLTEKKVSDLKALLKNATLIRNVDTHQVSIGTKTKLKFLASNQIKTYSIVGTHEANSLENKISNESPIVRAILGKKVNDIVTVILKYSQFQVRILGIYA